MEWLVIIAGFAFVATLAYSVYALDHHKVEKHQQGAFTLVVPNAP